MSDQAQYFRALIQRRVHGEPVAYLRGWVEWYGLELAVTSDVLIPRPDTEIVVEEAIALARRSGPRLVVDVGTGSGAIAIVLARALREVRVLAVDRSAAALALAGQNMERYGVANRILLLEGSLLEPFSERPDLIVANLPYLSDAMMAELDADVRHEPELALHGGASGLDLYEAMFEQMSQRGWSVPAVFEIDPREAEAAVQLAAMYFNDASVRVVPDLAGLDRAVIVEPHHG